MSANEEADILFPDLPIIDTHHHLFDQGGDIIYNIVGTRRFMIDEYFDLVVRDGHNVVASVAVDSHTMYRATGPEEFRVVGETEFFNGQGAMAASGVYGPCLMAAGLVCNADLRKDNIRAVLEAHIAAAPARFKGIRQEGLWDADSSVLGGLFNTGRHLYLTEDFRRGAVHMAELGLTFDAFILAPQLPDMIDLAKRFPNLQIVCNHLGSPVGIGAHKGRTQEEYPQWKRDMAELSKYPNVTVKVGGLGSFVLGSDFYRAEMPPKVQRLVDEWKPYVEPAIEMFGSERCMFESNVPTDGAGSFRNICNAMKTMTVGLSDADRRNIFGLTAARVYRLDVPALDA